MKKLAKILPVMIAILMILSIFSTVFADYLDPSGLDGKKADEFTNIGKRIIGMVQSVGSIISVLVLVILGIKYMMGSAEEKAEYKKTMIPYLVGAILVFAASNIAGVIYNFAITLNNTNV